MRLIYAPTEFYRTYCISVSHQANQGSLNHSPEKVNIITSSIIPHQKLIPSHNMLSKTRPDSLVLSFRIPRLDPADA
jgi:hypothetical protein